MQEENILEKREKLLLEAFDDKAFIKEVKNIRLELEEELMRFILFLKENLTSEQKIFENIEHASECI